jgi:hypothetical protein
MLLEKSADGSPEDGDMRSSRGNLSPRKRTSYSKF